MPEFRQPAVLTKYRWIIHYNTYFVIWITFFALSIHYVWVRRRYANVALIATRHDAKQVRRARTNPGEPMMRNLFFAAVATLAVVFAGPVSSGKDVDGHRPAPPSAVMTDLGGNG